MRLGKLCLVIGLAVFSIFALRASLADDAKPKPPNVLFIISDDLRAELGCYSGMAKTPNLDALAKSGVRFDRQYCQYPLCNPSRSSMLTGRHPNTTGVLGNRTWFGEAHPDFVSLPKYFKSKGYATLRTGKIFHGGIDDTEAWTEGGERRQFGGADNQEQQKSARLPSADPDESQPIVQSDQETATAGRATVATAAQVQPQLTQAQRSDRFIILPGDGRMNGDSLSAARASEYLREYKDKSQPFFLAVGFSKPHSPPAAPQKFYDLYDAEKIPLPPNFAPRPTVPEGFPRMSIRPRNADLFIGRDATEAEARQMIRAYLASTSFVDANVGRVIAELDKLGLRDNTIIVFWGDHGYQLGERGKWSKAGSLFEQGARTPCLVVAPGAKGNGQICSRVIQALDFYPTLCDLCGLPPPAELEGRSFAALLNDPSATWDHPAFTIWSEDGRTLHGVSVRNERWRYAEFGPNGSGGAMLFDEQADPQELKNVADDPQHATVRAELSKLVKQYVSKSTAK